MEKELLAITEILKEFQNMRFGQEIIIWTDHKNLTNPTTSFKCQQALRQWLIIKKIGPTIKFIKGKKTLWWTH